MSKNGEDNNNNDWFQRRFKWRWRNRLIKTEKRLTNGSSNNNKTTTVGVGSATASASTTTSSSSPTAGTTQQQQQQEYQNHSNLHIAAQSRKNNKKQMSAPNSSKNKRFFKDDEEEEKEEEKPPENFVIYAKTTKPTTTTRTTTTTTRRTAATATDDEWNRFNSSVSHLEESLAEAQQHLNLRKSKMKKYASSTVNHNHHHNSKTDSITEAYSLPSHNITQPRHYHRSSSTGSKDKASQLSLYSASSLPTSKNNSRRRLTPPLEENQHDIVVQRHAGLRRHSVGEDPAFELGERTASSSSFWRQDGRPTPRRSSSCSDLVDESELEKSSGSKRSVFHLKRKLKEKRHRVHQHLSTVMQQQQAHTKSISNFDVSVSTIPAKPEDLSYYEFSPIKRLAKNNTDNKNTSRQQQRSSLIPPPSNTLKRSESPPPITTTLSAPNLLETTVATTASPLLPPPSTGSSTSLLTSEIFTQMGGSDALPSLPYQSDGDDGDAKPPAKPAHTSPQTTNKSAVRQMISPRSPSEKSFSRNAIDSQIQSSSLNFSPAFISSSNNNVAISNKSDDQRRLVADIAKARVPPPPLMIHHDTTSKKSETKTESAAVAPGHLNLTSNLRARYFLREADDIVNCLHVAVLQRDLNTIRSIIQQSPRLVNQRSQRGDTPLHYAVYFGASSSSDDNDEPSPLQRQQQEMLEMLLRAYPKAVYRLTREHGLFESNSTCLKIAMDRRARPEILELLLETTLQQMGHAATQANDKQQHNSKKKKKKKKQNKMKY